MADDKFRLQKIILSSFLLFTCIQCSKLNVPRVLLPVFSSISSKFTLEATEGGCYKWSTTRADIINLTPLEEDKELKCSSKVLVSTFTKESARNIAVVLAEEITTKQNLRCDVIVDVIHSLAISTTTRELFMEEAPEAFDVKGYDGQGNEFSTLEEVEFEWKIVPLGPNKQPVVRYIAYKDSPYETPPAIAVLEKKQKKGYSILLEGVKTGSAKITVQLPYPEYKNVEATEVQLMVVANLIISPAEVYVMPGDVVSFKIFQINNGRMEEVKFPDSQYYIEAEKKEIASSVKKSGHVNALQEGDTRVVLRDRNVGRDDPMLKLPAANLHVVKPDYITLNVLPHKNWAILVADHHDIVAEVYSSKDQRLYLGMAAQVTIDVSPEFSVVTRSANGSWLTGYGTQPSVASVTATLDGVLSQSAGLVKFHNPIQTKADLLIHQRITVEPSEVILPWDPITKPKYDVDLVAKGGDNRFMWVSSDHSIGQVSQSGHVRTFSHGFFEVSAVMLRNHHNRKSTKFLILPPARLEIVEFVMESEIGSPVYLHVALYAEQQDSQGRTIQLPFTKCQQLPFQVKQSDLNFKQNKSAVIAPVGISCGNIAMVGLNVGTSKVTVSYYHDGKTLEDSATISAYKTLALIQPKGDIVLAVGSSVNLVYVGGPRPALGRSKAHQRVVVSEDETIASAKDITTQHTFPGEDYSAVQVVCRKLGETDIKLMISNQPKDAGCKPQTSSVTTRITCGKPRKITIQPELKVPDVRNCPMDLNTGSIVTQSSQRLGLDVNVYDDCGNRFLSVSSLNIDWTVEPRKAAVLDTTQGVIPSNISIGDVLIPDRNYQGVRPTIALGTITVNATINGYNTKVLRKYGITPEWPEFMGPEDRDRELEPIKASLQMVLVSDIVVQPNRLTLFNHPGNKQVVKIFQGSGYFELALNIDDVVDVKYSHIAKEIEITPMKSGEVTVQIIDLCLVAKPAVLTVSIVSVGMIRVDMVDKVEIGKCIPVIVRLYDENDNLLTIPDLAMIDLRPKFSDPIANIQRAEQNRKKPWGPGEIHYIVTGLNVGDTRLIFTVASNEEDVDSPPVNLQVFNPLRLMPRNATLLIGSTIQLTLSGGPQPDSEVVFTSDDSKIIEVDDKGVMIGRALGKTKIIAKAIGVHPHSGQSILYSQDMVELKVIALKNIRIGAPLTRFAVGTTVPFWVYGVPDISPLVLGSIHNPSVIFKWSVDDTQLVDMFGVFHPVGVSVMNPDRVVLKLTGLEVGTTRLTINATVPGATLNKPNVNNVTLSATVDIEVIQRLELTMPPTAHGKSLLMAPFSSTKIQTNLDSGTRMMYTLPGTQVASTEVLADKSVLAGQDVVTITSSGVLKSTGVLGHALLIVTSTDNTGLKQKLSIVVEVKPIHYMNLNVIANWRISSNNPMNVIPLGVQFQLTATYHDNIGTRFDAGPTDLKIKTSRCDLLKIERNQENGTITVYTKKPGHTMLKAWADGIEKTTDYLRINVKQSIKPILDHLTSCDTICLWAPVVSEYNLPGTWSSSDPELVQIDPTLDVAFVGNKDGTVVLTHTYLSAAPISLRVYPVSTIQMMPDRDIRLTNDEEGKSTSVALVLQSEMSVNVKISNLIQGWRCREDVKKVIKPRGFVCYMTFTNESSHLSAHDVFNVSSGWMPETGQYACVFTSKGIYDPQISVLTTNVTLWAETDAGDVRSERLVIPFMPALYTEPILYLAEDTNTGELIIIGLPSVFKQMKVQPADSSILYVDKGKLSSTTKMVYKVHLVDYHWRLADMENAMGIVITSPLTKQEIKVLVRVSGQFSGQMCGIGKSPIFNFLQNYKYAMLMATAMLVIFLLTFYFYSNYMQPIVNVNVNPARSPTQTSPHRCAAVMQDDASHRCGALFPLNRSLDATPPRSPNAKNNSGFNCTCRPYGDPVYGDPSSFSVSPTARRNRRFI